MHLWRKWSPIYRNYGYHDILMFLSGLICLLLISYALGWKLSAGVLFLEVLLITSLTRFIKQNYKKRFLWIALPCAVVVLLLWNYFFPFAFFKSSAQLLHWVPQCMNQSLPVPCRLPLFFYLAIPIVLLFGWMLKSRLIRRFLMLFSIVSLVLLGFFSYSSTRILPFSLIALLFLLFLEELHYSIPQITFLIPCVLSFALLVSVLPTSEKPISWRYVRFAYHQLADYASNLATFFGDWGWGTNKDFTVSMTGYSEQTNLGGDVADDDSVFLTAYLPTRPRNPLYLAGCYRNTFTGSSWEDNSSLNSKDEAKLDYWELLYAMARDKSWDKTSSLYRTRQIGITYRETNTRSIFFPLHLEDLSGKNLKTLKYLKGGNLRFSNTQREQSSYYMHYLEFNEGSEAYHELLTNQTNYSYQSRQKLPVEIRDGLMDHFYSATIHIPLDLEARLKQRRDQIYKDYLNVPKSTTQRVRDLAKEITAGLTSDYERLRAIEQYLTTNYTYSTSPGKPKKGTDLIDYFLFEKPVGYCTYFASAFAILGRCVGIPTRYVQGFLCNYEYSEGGAKYSIYGNDAHAWPEAYLEGIGWTSFEPTASYTETRYQEWQFAPSYVGTPSDSGPKHTNAYHAEDVERVDAEMVAARKKVAKEQAARTSRLIRQALLLVGLLLLLILVGVLIYWLGLYYNEKKRYRKMNTQQRYWKNYQSLLYLLDYVGHKKRPGETMRIYCDRIYKNWADEPIHLDIITRQHEQICYHQLAASEADLETLCQAINTMASGLHKKMGWPRYPLFMLRSGIVI